MQKNVAADITVFAGSDTKDEIFNVVFAKRFKNNNGNAVTFPENSYTFGCLERGSAELIVSDSTFTLSENEVFYITDAVSAFSRIQFTADAEGYFVSVNGSLPGALAKVYSIPSVAVRLADIRTPAEKLLNILKYTSNENYSLSMRESSGAFFDIILKFSAADVSGAAISGDLEAERIKTYIDNMIYNDPSLDDVKDHFGITKMHAIRVFKNHYNMTPMQYAINKRTEIASSLLKNTDLPIKTISDMLKYSNTQHFSNSFKKILGISPNKYRTTKN